MLDRAKMLRILVESSRRHLQDIDMALEELESGGNSRTNYSAIQRGFHTIKHDARTLALEKLARLAEASETIVERAADHRAGLPIDILRAASQEIRTATAAIAEGGRHRIDPDVLERVEAFAASTDAG